MGVLRRWGRPAGVVAAVVALTAAFGVLIGHGWAYPDRVTVDPRHPASLPGRVPGYSTLTGDVLSAPIGRAVALYNQNTGTEDAPAPQIVLAGADRDDYRRLLVDGSPSVLLKPDGRGVAGGGFGPP